MKLARHKMGRLVSGTFSGTAAGVAQ